MVHITPPADWAPDAAIPASAVAAALHGAPAEPALTISTSASTVLPTDFDFAQLEQPTQVATPTPIPALAAAEPAAGLPPLVWFSLTTAAVFVVAGLTYILWPSHVTSAPPTPVAATDTTAKPNTPPDDATEQPPVETDPYAADQTKQPPSETAPTATPAAPESEEASTTPTEPADSAKVADDSPPKALDAPAKPVETPTSEVEPPIAKVASATPARPAERADAPASSGGSDHVLKFDPLDFDPEHLSLSSKPSTGSTPSPAVAATASIPPEAAAETAPVAKAAASEKVPNPFDLLPAPAANQAVNVRRGPATVADAHSVDTAKHLATHVKSLQLTEMPLVRFAETISDLAGAPITLDPVTLELNGLSPRSTVSVDATDATVETVLKDALATQRLELVEQDGHVGIGLPNAAEQRGADFDVKDLATGDDAAPIAKLLEQFVAPQTWQAKKGKGTIEVKGTTLHIEQSLIARREALIFCERLRAARGLAQRSKYPAALLTVDSPYEETAAALKQSTTFTFLAWTRLDDVIRQWQETTGLAILVDWSALQEASFGPSSPVACSALDRPWTEALDGVLEPLKLGWWAVDGQTLQITSLEALDRIERVEFYALPKTLREQFPTAEALVASLQKEISDRPTKHGNPAEAHMSLDAPSGRLIVRTTPDVQRFLSDRLNGK